MSHTFTLLGFTSTLWFSFPYATSVSPPSACQLGLASQTLSMFQVCEQCDRWYFVSHVHTPPSSPLSPSSLRAEHLHLPRLLCRPAGVCGCNGGQEAIVLSRNLSGETSEWSERGLCCQSSLLPADKAGVGVGRRTQKGAECVWVDGWADVFVCL